MSQPTVPVWVMTMLVTIQAGLAYAIVNAAAVHAPELSLYGMGIAQVMLTALAGALTISRSGPPKP